VCDNEVEQTGSGSSADSRVMLSEAKHPVTGLACIDYQMLRFTQHDTAANLVRSISLLYACGIADWHRGNTPRAKDRRTE
jgi:hypothetical protein